MGYIQVSLNLIIKNSRWCRERQSDIDAIVIHYISGKYAFPEHKYNAEKVVDLLDTLHLSYHYLVDRKGGVYRLVEESKKAYHAGYSSLFGRKGANQFSIGVALIGEENIPFTDQQLLVSAKLCADIRERYSIPLNRIVGHEHVSPGRKVDPGSLFPWNTWLDKVAELR